MSMPFYVAPEQVMKDRADYARKGIARGRSLCAVQYDEGILICAELMQEISEIPGVSGVNLMTTGDPKALPAAIRASGLRLPK